MTSIGAVLFSERVPAQAGSVSPKIDKATERLARSDALPSRPGSASIARDVIMRLPELLHVEVGDVLIGAWHDQMGECQRIAQTRLSLLRAARETWANPGTSRNVTLQSFAFPWEYELDVDITVNGLRFATITFTVAADVEVTALAAVVESGRITKISGGTTTVAAALRATSGTGPSVLLAQAERECDLKYEVRLGGAGIPLIEEARTP